MRLRGGPVFLAFFLLFTIASIAVPVPMFPGNLVAAWVLQFDLELTGFVSYISALANGLMYGFVIWLVFVLATRKLDESGVSDYKAGKRRGQRSRTKRVVKYRR